MSAEHETLSQAGLLAFSSWPVNFWRFDPLDERDFEWFERK